MSAEPVDVQSLLSRPLAQRRMEYKYRCAQAIVFGIPVLVLQFFGLRLGGPEAMRWVAILQALLSGWVVYVGAAGMLAEGLLLLGSGVQGDLIIAIATVAIYLFSAVSTIGVFVRGQPFYQPLLFHWAVLILAGWCGWKWWRTPASVPI